MNSFGGGQTIQELVVPMAGSPTACLCRSMFFSPHIVARLHRRKPDDALISGRKTARIFLMRPSRAGRLVTAILDMLQTSQ